MQKSLQELDNTTAEGTEDFDQSLFYDGGISRSGHQRNYHSEITKYKG